MIGIQLKLNTACRFTYVLVAAACMLVADSSVLQAQTYDAYATTDSVTVGDRFNIVVAVEHDGSGHVVFPHSFIPDSLRQGSGWSLGDFVFLGESEPGRRVISSSWVVDSVSYEVATFALDTAFVALLPVGLISETDTLVAATPPVEVPVTSLVPDDAESIRDITDIADFPASLWLWWGLLFLVLAAWALWYFKLRHRGEEEIDPDVVPEPDDPPWDEAQERLKRLEETDLSVPALIKPFYVELSEILRTYLERRTKVPALESSTTELIGKLEDAVRDRLVPSDMVNEIRQVLAQADLVKFAKMEPPSSVGVSAIAHARTAIDETEKEMTGYESRIAALRAEAEAKAAAAEARDQAAKEDRTEAETTGTAGDGSHQEHVLAEKEQENDSSEFKPRF